MKTAPRILFVVVPDRLFCVWADRLFCVCCLVWDVLLVQPQHAMSGNEIRSGLEPPCCPGFVVCLHCMWPGPGCFGPRAQVGGDLRVPRVRTCGSVHLEPRHMRLVPCGVSRMAIFAQNWLRHRRNQLQFRADGQFSDIEKVTLNTCLPTLPGAAHFCCSLAKKSWLNSSEAKKKRQKR